MQPCDERHFDELASGDAAWLVATVPFREGDATGVLSCSLPEDLARKLLDAFTGRDPREPQPSGDAVFDLVGELSNMICGTWLTTMATAIRASRSAGPRSKSPPRRPTRTAAAARVAVNDLPLLVSIALNDVALAPAGH